ncbi:D-amino acid dehydrogenase [Kordiimonas marina]|uniref:D-amino acid dehydrogenase n=1 Tax=Kordiimonas marina TaxID=2872312 RepID=UPI001FF64C25|nr:D-amino acid dehydrogenase [Kordiimonas marina]MCJ9427978.1 D-amino acid dehydrogenase [Kordiimonas marina]
MKAVIIGAGLQGIATAYFLSKAGLDVTVLERRETAGLETSYANGGILTPSMSDPWNAPGCWKEMLLTIGREDSPLMVRPKALPSMIGWGLKFLGNATAEAYARSTAANFKLGYFSVDMMHEIRAEQDIAYDFSPRGTLKLYSDPKLLAQKTSLLDQLVPHGLRFDILSPREIVAHEPALAPTADRLVGGFYFPDDESGDAHKFCQALMEKTKALGVTYHFNCEVTGFSHAGDSIAEVIAGEDRFLADNVILATGTFSAGLARKVGMRLPIQPVKGYSLTLPTDGMKHVPSIPIVDDSLHAAITPLGDRLRVAGTAEFAGFDRTLSTGRIENLRDILSTIYPALAGLAHGGDGEAWCDFRPMSADGVPLIGKLGAIDNLYINAGHGPLGWTMAAGSGRLLTDLITGKAPDIDPAPYRTDRPGL